MCGIFGYTKSNGIIIPDWKKILRHRGPDESGSYEDKGIFIAHTRLSIIDVSLGSQPMKTADQRYVITFNGEIYNYKELKKDLCSKNYSFSTNSDTEVLLYMFCEYGVQMLNRLDGMFAFAIWDTHKQKLFLARDPVGKKPLYYIVSKGLFAFGSEIKTLLPMLHKHPELNPIALADYLKFGYVGKGYTIFKDVQELNPGHFLTVSQDNSITNSPYWNPDLSTKNISMPEALSEIKELLSNAIKKRLISDVPFGLFLSGGLDSTYILHEMHQHLGDGIPVFNINFKEDRYDESEYAKTAANLYHADFKTYTFSDHDLINNAPRIIQHMDQPHADPSILALFSLSEKTSQNVKMVLSGEGGDELFMGYTRYKALLSSSYFPEIKLWQHMKPFFSSGLYSPKKNRRILSKWFSSLLGPMSSRYYTWISTGESWSKLLKPDYFNLSENSTLLFELKDIFMKFNPLHSARLFDLFNYMPSQLLKKADMATMYHGLELRCPFLDKKLIEYMLTLPEKYNINLFNQKILLKSIFSQSLPPILLKRKKHGFTIPVDQWLRGPLREQIKNTILNSNFIHSICNIDILNNHFESHHSAEKNYGKPLWLLFILSHWANENKIGL